VILGVLILLVGVGLAVVLNSREKTVEPIEADTVLDKPEDAVAAISPTGYVSVPISTQPAGATILRDGEDTGKKTPTTLAYKMGEKVDLSFSLPGYLRYDAQLVAEPGAHLKLNLVPEPSSNTAVIPDKDPEAQIIKQPVQPKTHIDKKPTEKTVGKVAEVVEEPKQPEPVEKMPGVDRLDYEKPKVEVDRLD
jgi:hypothetical protein